MEAVGGQVDGAGAGDRDQFGGCVPEVAGDDGQVVRRRVKAVIVESGRIREVGVAEPEGLRLGVHLLDEQAAWLDTRCQRFRGIVAGDEEDAVQKLPNGQLLAAGQPHHCPVGAGLGSLGRDGQEMVEGDVVEGHQHRHHLGQAGRRPARVGIVAPQDLAHVGIDQDRALGLEPEIRCGMLAHPVAPESEWWLQGGAAGRSFASDRPGLARRQAHGFRRSDCRDRIGGREEDRRQQEQGDILPPSQSGRRLWPGPATSQEICRSRKVSGRRRPADADPTLPHPTFVVQAGGGLVAKP